MRAGGLALAALLAAACRLTDGRGRLELKVIGPSQTRNTVTVRLESDIAAKAWLSIGGEDAREATCGEDLEIALGPEEGTYRLEAHAYDGSMRLVAEPVDVVLDRSAPRQVGLVPAAGWLFAPGPVRLQARFDEPLGPATAITFRTCWDGACALGPVAAHVEGASAVVEVDALALDADPRAEGWLLGLACDVAGNCSSAVGSWRAPTVAGQVWVTNAVAGVVGARAVVTGTWTPSVEADVLVDGVVAGRLTPGGTAELDVRGVPDGHHALGLDVPGAHALPSAGTLHVDHTEPRLTECRFASYGGMPWIIAGVVLTFDEDVTGLPYPSSSSWPITVYPPHPGDPFPDRWQLDLTGTTDLGGNPLQNPLACALPVQPWMSSADGPVTTGGMSEVATRVAVASAGAVWLERAAPAAAGGVGLFQVRDAAWEEVPYSVGPVLVPAELAAGGAGEAAWLAPAEGGGALVERRCPDNAVPGTALLQPAPGQPGAHLAIGAGCGIAWTVPGPSSWALELSWPHLAWSCSAYGCGWVTERTGTSVALPERPDGLAVSVPFVAWVEVPGLLRVGKIQDLDDGSIDVEPAPLNRDLFAAASEPSIGDGVVAWVEGDEVLARRLLTDGAWSGPEVLNGTPGSTGRSPRVVPDGIVLVERSEGRDRIELRRWDESARRWKALTGLDPGGDVAFLSAAGFVVGWVDGAGAVRVRAYNR